MYFSSPHAFAFQHVEFLGSKTEGSPSALEPPRLRTVRGEELHAQALSAKHSQLRILRLNGLWDRPSGGSRSSPVPLVWEVDLCRT